MIERKQGFSIVEILVIFTVVSVLMAGMIPMISKKTRPLPKKIQHGIYRCIPESNGTTYREELYSGTKHLSTSTGNSSCTFKVPKAALYKIDLYTAGNGGTKYAAVQSSDGDVRTQEYHIGSNAVQNTKKTFSASTQVREMSDSELYHYFEGQTVKYYIRRPNAASGGVTSLTYKTPAYYSCLASGNAAITQGYLEGVLAEKQKDEDAKKATYNKYIADYKTPYDDAVKAYNDADDDYDDAVAYYNAAVADLNSCKNTPKPTKSEYDAAVAKKEQAWKDWPSKISWSEYSKIKDECDAIINAYNNSSDCSSYETAVSNAKYYKDSAYSARSSAATTKNQKYTIYSAHITDINNALTAWENATTAREAAQANLKAFNDKLGEVTKDNTTESMLKIIPKEWLGKSEEYNKACYNALATWHKQAAGSTTQSGFAAYDKNKVYASIRTARAVISQAAGGSGGYSQLEYTIHYNPRTIKNSSITTFKEFLQNLNNKDSVSGFYPVHCSTHNPSKKTDCEYGKEYKDWGVGISSGDTTSLGPRQGKSNEKDISEASIGAITEIKSGDGQGVKEAYSKPYFGYHIPSYFGNLADVSAGGWGYYASSNNADLPTGGKGGVIKNTTGTNNTGLIDTSIAFPEEGQKGSNKNSYGHDRYNQGYYSISGSDDTGEYQEPYLTQRSELWYKLYSLGKAGQSGQHKVYNVNNLGTTCKMTPPHSGPIHDKITAIRNEKIGKITEQAYLDELRKQTAVSITCYDDGDKVVYSQTLLGTPYDKNNTTEFDYSKYGGFFYKNTNSSNYVHTASNGNTKTRTHGSSLNLTPTSYWHKLKNSINNLDSYAIGYGGSGTILKDSCTEPKGSYSVQLWQKSKTALLKTKYRSDIAILKDTKTGKIINPGDVDMSTVLSVGFGGFGNSYGAKTKRILEYGEEVTDTSPKSSIKSESDSYAGVKAGLDCYSPSRKTSGTDTYVLDFEGELAPYKKFYTYEDMLKGGPGAVVITW